MISNVLEELRKRGFLKPSFTPFCTNLVRHVKLFYLFADGDGLFVKITNGGEAKREYFALQSVRNVLGRHVPNPLLLIESSPHTAFVTPLFKHRGMDLEDLRNGRICDQIGFLLNSDLGSKQSSCFYIPVSVEEIRCFFENKPFVIDWPDWIIGYMEKVGNSVYSELPVSAQHGDFTLYNFGVCGSLVMLFDWEDYGKVEFWGFDIASFMFSLIIAQKAGKLVASTPSRMFDLRGGNLVLNALESKSIRDEVFMKYFPFYVLSFLYLKKELGYGLRIIEETKNFLQLLLTSKQWQQLMLSE
jgi:hypothetical protein